MMTSREYHKKNRAYDRKFNLCERVGEDVKIDHSLEKGIQVK